MKTTHNNFVVSIFIISILALALFSPWSKQVGLANFSIYKSLLAAIASSLLLCATCWFVMQRQTNQMPVAVVISWITSSFLLLFMLGGLSVFWSINVSYTISGWAHWFIALATFIAAYHLPIDRANSYKLCWGLLSAAFIIATIGVMQYWWNPFVLFQYAPPAATFGNKNIATHALVLILPVSFYLLSAKHLRLSQIWLISLMTITILLYVFYTQTRSSWVAIVSQLLLIGGFLYVYRRDVKQYIYWSSHKQKAVWVCCCLLLLLINLKPTGWEWFFLSAGERLSSVTSVNARLDIWAMTIDMIKDNPLLGSGLSTWYQNQVQEGYGRPGVTIVVRAHNDLLELGADLGLLGVLLLLVGAGAITYAAVKLLRLEKQYKQPLHILYFVVWVGLTGSFVQMQFTFPYQEPVPIFLFGFYIGLMARAAEVDMIAIKTITVSMPKRLYQGSLWVCLLCSLVVIVIHLDWFKTHRQLSSMAGNGFAQAKLIPTPDLDHRVYHGVLRILSASYAKKQQFEDVIVIESKLLSDWPHDNLGLTYLAYGLIAEQQYDEALVIAKHLQQVAVQGYYYGQLLELLIYQYIGQEKQLLAAWQRLLEVDESLLARDANTYRNMLAIAIDNPVLHEFVDYLYQQSITYHSHHCTSENHIADYYWQQQAYGKAAQHLHNTQLLLGDACIDQKWSSLLAEKSLAIILSTQ